MATSARKRISWCSARRVRYENERCLTVGFRIGHIAPDYVHVYEVVRCVQLIMMGIRSSAVT